MVTCWTYMACWWGFVNCWFVRYGDFFMCSFWFCNVWRTRHCFCFLKTPFFPGFVSVALLSQARKSVCLPSAESEHCGHQETMGSYCQPLGRCCNCRAQLVLAWESNPNLSVSVSETRLEGWLSMPVRNNTKRFGWEKKVP